MLGWFHSDRIAKVIIWARRKATHQCSQLDNFCLGMRSLRLCCAGCSCQSRQFHLIDFCKRLCNVQVLGTSLKHKVRGHMTLRFECVYRGIITVNVIWPGRGTNLLSLPICELRQSALLLFRGGHLCRAGGIADRRTTFRPVIIRAHGCMEEPTREDCSDCRRSTRNKDNPSSAACVRQLTSDP